MQFKGFGGTIPIDYILEFSFIIFFFCEKSKLQDQKLISEELSGVKKLLEIPQ
jgi:hypothetical protein